MNRIQALFILLEDFQYFSYFASLDGYLTNDIFYKWKDGSSSVTISSDINLAQFSVVGQPRIVERQIGLTTGIWRIWQKT